jgi:hypothetical protein
MKYLWNILISIDQLANTLFGGDPDETISSRAGKDKKKGKCWAICLCWILNKWDTGHCEKHAEEDEGEDNSF